MEVPCDLWARAWLRSRANTSQPPTQSELSKCRKLRLESCGCLCESGGPVRALADQAGLGRPPGFRRCHVEQRRNLLSGSVGAFAIRLDKPLCEEGSSGEAGA